MAAVPPGNGLVKPAVKGESLVGGKLNFSGLYATGCRKLTTRFARMAPGASIGRHLDQ